MVTPQLLSHFLESLKDPYTFADTDHVIRYMNRVAMKHYSKWGGAELIGKSLLDCHNETSCKQIVEILAKMHDGLDEELITDNEKHRIYMRAVRDEEGKVIGYYERYEPPVQS